MKNCTYAVMKQPFQLESGGSLVKGMCKPKATCQATHSSSYQPDDGNHILDEVPNTVHKSRHGENNWFDEEYGRFQWVSSLSQ